MEAFSDGVFAIAITLLVLEISVPSGSETGPDLLNAVLGQWPSYLAFAVSFSTIGAIWLAHNAVTEQLAGVDTSFVRLNLLLLLVVSFLPFPTRLLAEHVGSNEAERVATTIYGITLLLALTMVSVLWRYARRAELVRETIGDEEMQYLTNRLTPGLAGYGVLLVLGLVLPRAAVFGYFAIALFFLLPIRRRSSRRTLLEPPPETDDPPG
ncbi:MAG TPA: TMEM175 family protein [Candidatus Limnocylindrales bacterium]|jgi:uncharacterized membrane protein